IRIGSADVFISPGPHQYKIEYRTNRQIAFLKDFDELYWNVTGNAWEFPIDKALAIIHLPNSAPIIHSAPYTAPQAPPAKDFRVITQAPGLYKAETTRSLQPGEGFTVAIAFPKGILTPPTQTEEAQAFMSDNAGIVAAIVGLLAAFLYYLYAWLRVGRDPPK